MAYLTLDHQHPISRGGLNTIHNILPLCQVCHAIKDGDPDVMPWDKEKVMARRERKNKARAFFHYLVREVVGVNDATYYLEMRQKHVEAAELDGDESTFGEFLTEHLLMTYVDLVRSGDLPMRKWGF